MEKWATEEPLALSGLALAGANQGLSGLVDRDTGDDGLLYSLEILSLDLQGTELVSLAACDTGMTIRKAYTVWCVHFALQGQSQCS